LHVRWIEEACVKTSPNYDRIAEDYDRRFEFFDDSRVTKLVLGFACSESSLRVLDGSIRLRDSTSL
jgi:hypothetical protein